MSTDAVLTQVREAIGQKKTVRISGAGSWMNAGRPVDAVQNISLASDTGVVDYVPDDLTITVRAGTTLSEISAATRANGQWLPLDPFGGGTGTIGATIATASSGPLSHSSGTVRDFVLGLELVTGKGDIIRTGGRVVKNVAGFDLMRLNCGAWGTLGVITEVSLRLYSLAKVDRTFALEAPEGKENVGRFLTLLRSSPLAALSLELLSASLGKRVGVSERPVVLVRLAGNTPLVDAQIKTLFTLGSPREIEANVWDSLSVAHTAATTFSMRLSCLPTNVSDSLCLAQELCATDSSAFYHSTVSRGITRVAGFTNPVADIPKPKPELRVAYEIMPPDFWQNFSPSVVADRLSANVKRAYDPHCILNPGILG